MAWPFYPANADSCISKFYFNQEEFGKANGIGRFVLALQGR
jgi:hypothetical protein